MDDARSVVSQGGHRWDFVDLCLIRTQTPADVHRGPNPGEQSCLDDPHRYGRDARTPHTDAMVGSRLHSGFILGVLAGGATRRDSLSPGSLGRLHVGGHPVGIFECVVRQVPVAKQRYASFHCAGLVFDLSRHVYDTAHGSLVTAAQETGTISMALGHSNDRDLIIGLRLSVLLCHRRQAGDDFVNITAPQNLSHHCFRRGRLDLSRKKLASEGCLCCGPPDRRLCLELCSVTSTCKLGRRLPNSSICDARTRNPVIGTKVTWHRSTTLRVAVPESSEFFFQFADAFLCGDPSRLFLLLFLTFLRLCVLCLFLGQFFGVRFC